MSRDWKPGDVAMVEMGGGSNVAIWTGEFWVWSNGDGPFDGVSHCHRDRPARPVIVIDPDDREALEPIWLALRAARSMTSRDNLQAGLRSLFEPPKPEEPTGLGAVVETIHGEMYVRDKTTTTVAHWKRARGEDSRKRYRYADLNVVRVLSEGVQP